MLLSEGRAAPALKRRCVGACSSLLTLALRGLGFTGGGGLPREAGGGPGLAHRRYWGNLPCRAGPGEVSTLLLHRQRAGPGPWGWGRAVTPHEDGSWPV